MRHTKEKTSLKIDFPMEETVRKRCSTRNYADRELEAQKRRQLELFTGSLDNPFGKKVNFHYLDDSSLSGQQKLGTYGIIKGARHFIGASVKAEPMALEALGYELEAVILYLAHLGLGSCWLGGTFKRKEFAKAMAIADDELFPIISPYGYAAPKMHLTETLMRKMIKADHRKSWEKLFFSQDFQQPLTKREAGELGFPLEMLRLGPSASNKQPWRVLLKGKACHFYEFKEPGYSNAFPYDIQSVDMGIAAAHFDLSAREKGLRGHFERSCEPALALPANTQYAFSWVRE